ncbi:MAG: hypothetical protein KDI30_03685 [Pseudomonadales bacterium]|nr:hypothetical protein [Pseudomonadales bacterium]
MLLSSFSLVAGALTWTTSSVPGAGTLNNIAAANASLYVAVGNGDVVATSGDGGTSWALSSNTSGLVNTFYNDVTWTGSQFVAVGGGGASVREAIATSPDGINWTSRSAGGWNYMEEVIWSGSQFLAIGPFSSPVRSSADAITWQNESFSASGYPQSIAWSGSQFALGDAAGGIATSSSGTSWTARYTMTNGSSDAINGMAWGNGRFVGVGNNGAAVVSVDGVSWVETDTGVAQTLYDIAWNGSTFMAVGSGGVIRSSPDGVAWSAQTSPTTSTLKGITWDGSRFLVVGSSGIFLVSSGVDVDTDSDGYLDGSDAFPDDPAASLDGDGDGIPDQWNSGKSAADSTTGLTYLDAFPEDIAASLDTDGDGYPDSWNPGKSESDSTTGLTLDTHPSDPNLPVELFPLNKVFPVGWQQVAGTQANWSVDNTRRSEGQVSLRSGSITHNETSGVEVSSLCEAGNISFDYKVSSEAGYDFLSFYIDDVGQGSWSGSTGWVAASYPVTAGQHTFKWVYSKDGSASSGDDAGWIDNVSIPVLLLSSTGESDFDADGDDDVLLRSSGSNAWRLFSMQNGAVTGNAGFALSTAAQWQHVVNFDADGDLDKDVLLRNSSNGQWRLYITENGAVVSDVSLALYASTSYAFKAALDVDADGDQDILIRNNTDGKWKLFFMENGAVSSVGSFYLWSNLSYELAFVGDFDGDLDDDLVLRGSDGKYRLFVVESGAVTGFSGIGEIYASGDYLPQVSSDFDGDGDDDVIIRNTLNGKWRLYRFQNNAVAGAAAIYPYQNTDYLLQTEGDFDGDGDSDLLLRNSSGVWRLFTLQNGVVTGNTPVGLYSNTDWQIQR